MSSRAATNRFATADSVDLSTVKFSRRLQDRLIRAGASAEAVALFVEVRGLASGAPLSLRSTSSELSAEGVRKVVAAVAEGPLRMVLADQGFVSAMRERMAPFLKRLAQECPGDEEHLAFRLGPAFMRTAGSPSSLIRLADHLGCEHDLRISRWSGRSKYKGADRAAFATTRDRPRVEQVVAIVPIGAVEAGEALLSLASRLARGNGCVSAAYMASRFGMDHGIPLTAHEAEAVLRPFAVHLGRHDGDEWYTFINCANEFLAKAQQQVKLFQSTSFQALRTHHIRRNRSSYTVEGMGVPDGALRAALEAAGLDVTGDAVTQASRQTMLDQASAASVQARIMRVYKQVAQLRGNARGVHRADLLAALMADGVREATARMYLTNKALFTSSAVYCRPKMPM